jgi:hypothetical protein
MAKPNHDNGEIDWAGIRAAAVTLGIRRAARNAAKDLPPGEAKRLVDRIRKRAEREGWSQDKAKALAAAQHTNTTLVTTSGQSTSPTVATGAQSVATALAEDSKQTRVGLSTATRKAATVFAGMEGETVINKSEDLRRIVSSASQIHGWDEQRPGEGRLTLQMLGGRALIQINNRSEKPDPALTAKPVEAITVSSTTPGPPPIDLEALRILTLAVGPDEAARRMSVPIERALPFAAK